MGLKCISKQNKFSEVSLDLLKKNKRRHCEVEREKSPRNDVTRPPPPTQSQLVDVCVGLIGWCEVKSASSWGGGGTATPA